ncbi:MAG: hypothetical protein PHX34_01235 [Candidatus Shapirobacteria bacterium]|nr:hypothetical protein [Candidatus Shapirobacteria bacterium]
MKRRNEEKRKILPKFLIIISILVILLIMISFFIFSRKEVNINSNKTSSFLIDNPTKNDKYNIEFLPKFNVKWTTYKNNKLGFSIKIPESIMDVNSCPGDIIPIKVFEDENDVYLNYAYLYASEKVSSNDPKCPSCYFNKTICNQKLPFKIEDVRNEKIWDWRIRTAIINNETELETYIKKEFGSNCSLKEKKESEQIGVYNISINRANAKCEAPLIVFKYYSKNNKIAYWSIEGGCTFTDYRNEKCLDTEIINSFQFN